MIVSQASSAARCGLEVQRRGGLGGGRVAQHDVAGDDDRRFARSDREPAQQLIGERVGLEVQEAVGDPVARQELAQPAAVGGEVRADEAHPGAESDQQRPAGHERAEEHVAELLVVLDDLDELGVAEHDHLAGRAHDGRVVRGLAGDQAELAGEPLLAVYPDRLLTGRPEPVDDRHAPAEHDEEVRRGLSGPEEDVAHIHLTTPAGRIERGDELVAQPRECCVVVEELFRHDTNGANLCA